MEDDQNVRRQKWKKDKNLKMTQMEDDQNER